MRIVLRTAFLQNVGWNEPQSDGDQSWYYDQVVKVSQHWNEIRYEVHRRGRVGQGKPEKGFGNPRCAGVLVYGTIISQPSLEASGKSAKVNTHLTPLVQ